MNWNVSNLDRNFKSQQGKFSVLFNNLSYIPKSIPIHLSAVVKVDKENRQDFGISTGKRRACTYFPSQETCGGPRPGTLNLGLKGQSLNAQRAETLMTVTGWIRGSFVSKLHCYNKCFSCFSLIWLYRERVATTLVEPL